MLNSFAVSLFTDSIRRQGPNNYSDTVRRGPYLAGALMIGWKLFFSIKQKHQLLSWVLCSHAFYTNAAKVKGQTFSLLLKRAAMPCLSFQSSSRSRKKVGRCALAVGRKKNLPSKHNSDPADNLPLIICAKIMRLHRLALCPHGWLCCHCAKLTKAKGQTLRRHILSVSPATHNHWPAVGQGVGLNGMDGWPNPHFGPFHPFTILHNCCQ